MKNVNIHVMSGDPLLHSHAQMIRKEAEKSLQIILKYISVANMDIIIANLPENIGSGTFSVLVQNNHLANIAINIKHKHFNKFFRTDLLEALAYALYRMARTQKMGYSKNLLEDCIEEGLAFNFQTEVSGDKSEPHFMELKNIKSIKSVVLRAKKEFYSTQYSHNDWFVGSKKRKIPQFTGYIIGYAIIKRFLKNNPHYTPSKLVETKAKSIVKNNPPEPLAHLV